MENTCEDIMTDAELAQIMADDIMNNLYLYEDRGCWPTEEEIDQYQYEVGETMKVLPEGPEKDWLRGVIRDSGLVVNN